LFFFPSRYNRNPVTGLSPTSTCVTYRKHVKKRHK
jgi:hypothetical protein